MALLGILTLCASAIVGCLLWLEHREEVTPGASTGEDNLSTDCEPGHQRTERSSCNKRQR
jgi:predicted outer membrane lipoprotein